MAEVLPGCTQTTAAGRALSGSMLRRNHLPIARPCSADWSAMAGDDRRRFCGACERDVIHLSRMTTTEALRTLERHLGGRVCVRYTVDRAGAIEFADPAPPRRSATALAGAALATAVLAGCIGHGDDDREVDPPDGEGICELADEEVGRCQARKFPPPGPPAPLEPEATPEPAGEQSPAAPTGRSCDGLVEAVPVPETQEPSSHSWESEPMGDIPLTSRELRHMQREAERRESWRETRRAARAARRRR